jgi:hypothetical protein
MCAIQQRQANSCNECLPIYRAPGSGVIDPVVRSKLCEQCAFKKATEKSALGRRIGATRLCIDCVPPTTVSNGIAKSNQQQSAAPATKPTATPSICIV